MKRFAAWFSMVATLATTFAPGAYARQTQSGTQKPTTPARRTTTHMTTDSALLHPATLTARAPDKYEVKFTTTKGVFVVEVTRGWAPLGADRFYNLVKHHFYDDASFFRVLPGFVVQFGLSANPQISKVWQHANIKDDHVSQRNEPGFITFATAGPNTRTTQVFINLGNNTQLDSMGFAPFGQVTSGMEVVQQLYSGYGEGAPNGRGPDQGIVGDQGKTYLDKNFPNLDSIKTATVVSPVAAPAAPGHKPATSGGGAAKP
jgi:peptidyl-prolyl cis-trans isomerase A (cyclophilin A)